MSWGFDCEEVFVKTRKNIEWKQSILDAMRARVDAGIQLPVAIPTQAGGWWHQFVCPEHELPLIFEPGASGRYVCPHGCVLEGEDYDAAYRVFVHRHYASLARDAAVLYQMTGEERYFDASMDILNRYAALYVSFDGGKDADPWMLNGKAFRQALTEAIWCIPLAQAYSKLMSYLDDMQSESLASRLFVPVAETLLVAHHKLVFEQNHLESNYTAWLIAALGTIGFVLEDESLIQQMLYEEGGFIDHQNTAVLPDGFEYEGTPYYHNFVTLAYILLAETALEHGVDLYVVRGEQGQSIEKMLAVLPRLMWPDGSIPMLHDGNYWQGSSFDTELCEVYEIAFAQTGNPEFGWLLSKASQRSNRHRDNWAAIWRANQDISTIQRPAMRSSLIKDVGIGILRDPAAPDGLVALMRFGSYGSGHTHRDCLGVLIHPFSLDAGNPPYGVESRRSWYQQSAAHNVVMVDGHSQQPAGGRLVEWISEPGRSVIEGAADHAYEGVQYSRRIELVGGRIFDHSVLSASRDHTYDWLFHTDESILIENLELSPAAGGLYSEGPGYMIKLVGEGVIHGPMRAAINQSGKQYHLILSSSHPMKIYLARSPKRGGKDMSKRYTLIARVHEETTEFTAIYEKI